jgi:hemerythrin-like metal-binding protein
MWYSQYTVGDIEIDEQHLNIDYMLTRLAREVDENSWQLLADIVEQLKRHFLFEEEVSLQRGYSMTAEHQGRHRQLDRQLTGLLHSTGEHQDQLLSAIMLIQDLLVEHIRDYDRTLIRDA